MPCLQGAEAAGRDRAVLVWLYHLGARLSAGCAAELIAPSTAVLPS